MIKNKNLYAVILAGGSGTRFWPVSRKANPKQFLNIAGKGTLLQETLTRVKPLVSAENIFIVTNASYRQAITSQAVQFKVPKENILLEPAAKNTAPAILWAAARINKANPDAVMVVLPSDHLILNQNKFLNVLGEAIKLAQEDFLVTLGIAPNRPETGYGYLKTVKKRNIVMVERFTEKPTLSKAKQFVKSKNYFWNSGMFVWKAEVILKEFQQYLPKMYKMLVGTGLRPTCNIKSIWGNLESISIDYGILEKAKNVVVVPAPDIGWSDLGSWESLTEILDQDKQGNIFKGDVVSVDCKNTLVWGEKKVIAPIGLENMIIVDTPDALLICPRTRSQDVKAIVDQLKKKKRSEV